MDYRLVLESGGPADPPVYHSNEPGWQGDDEIIVTRGKHFRIVRVVDDPIAMSELLGGDTALAADTYRVLVVKSIGF